MTTNKYFVLVALLHFAVGNGYDVLPNQVNEVVYGQSGINIQVGQFQDVNGDGLIDMMAGGWVWGQKEDNRIWLNTGCGFVLASEYEGPCASNIKLIARMSAAQRGDAEAIFLPWTSDESSEVSEEHSGREPNLRNTKTSTGSRTRLHPEVARALKEADVAEYTELLASQWLDMTSFLALTPKHLTDMGITKMGPRMRIERAIRHAQARLVDPELGTVLDEAGLSQYRSLFASRGISLANAHRMHDGDLQELGIDLSMHRSQLRSALYALRGSNMTPCPPGNPNSYETPGNSSFLFLNQWINGGNNNFNSISPCSLVDVSGDGLNDLVCQFTSNSIWNPRPTGLPPGSIDCKYTNTGSGWRFIGGMGFSNN